MNISVELLLLAMSGLFFVSLMAGKAGYRFGVPALLLFLSVGMLAGSDGLGIHFEDLHTSQAIGTVALCFILFSGGMDTKIEEIRPVVWQGVILATFGVLITAVLTGLVTWWVLGMTHASAGVGLTTSLLLAATMSSTDSASVFSILRSRGLHLKNNLRPMLELESGSNDPMAYILTITLIQIIRMGSSPNYVTATGMLLSQLAIGAALGYALGRLAVPVINRIRIDNQSLYPILLLTICLFIFSSVHFMGGNAYLAVYVGGLILGNSRFAHKRSSMAFFDGLAWLSQLTLFLTLGLLVNPRELLPIAVPGLIISAAMILITRPATVFFCLLPFRKMPFADKSFVSWVGLRGAVPIIFAMIPLVENVPHARLIFNIVFFCTLTSLVIQGTTLPKVAQWLHLTEEPAPIRGLESFDLDISDEVKSVTTEITVNQRALLFGNTLMEMPLPENTIVVLVRRGDKYFVPTGQTPLMENDRLLIITDDHAALLQTLVNMGLEAA